MVKDEWCARTGCVLEVFIRVKSTILSNGGRLSKWSCEGQSLMQVSRSSDHGKVITSAHRWMGVLVVHCLLSVIPARSSQILTYFFPLTYLFILWKWRSGQAPLWQLLELPAAGRRCFATMIRRTLRTFPGPTPGLLAPSITRREYAIFQILLSSVSWLVG